MFTSLLGLFSHNVFFHDSSRTYHLTFFRKENKRQTSASTINAECDMNNELQVFLTSLSLLATVVQVNSAFWNATTVYIHRRQDIIQAICN